MYGFYKTDLLVYMTWLISLEYINEKVSGEEWEVTEGKKWSLTVNNFVGKISINMNHMVFVLQEDIKIKGSFIYDGRYSMWGVYQDAEFYQC